MSQAQNNAPNTHPHITGSSFKLVTIAGIPIRIHFTFLLLLVFIAASGIGSEAGKTTGAILFVLLLFTCVVLHELGHALAAKRYHIRTRDIVLYPIGGIASLETAPSQQNELWIALAGPVVNLILAIVLGVAMFFVKVKTGFTAQMIGNLRDANAVLFLFNMIPAFPMDGGRVLRSLLSRRMNELMATRTAAAIGQSLALLGGLYALFTLNLLFLLVAVFVYMAAGAEANSLQTKVLISGHYAHEAMISQFHTLELNSSLKNASELMMETSQHDFPIFNGNEIVGLLTRENLLRGLAVEGPAGYVAASMQRDLVKLLPSATLEELLMQMPQNGAVLVMDKNALQGIVTRESLIDFLSLLQMRYAGSGSS